MHSQANIIIRPRSTTISGAISILLYAYHRLFNYLLSLNESSENTGIGLKWKIIEHRLLICFEIGETLNILKLNQWLWSNLIKVLIAIFRKLYQNIFQWWKTVKFLGDLKSMTNDLSLETNLIVLAQFDEKWHKIFQSSLRSLKRKINMVKNCTCSSQICGI